MREFIILMIACIGVLCTSVIGDINYIKREHKSNTFVWFFLFIRIISYIVIDYMTIMILIKNFSESGSLMVTSVTSLTLVIFLTLVILQAWSIVGYIKRIQELNKLKTEEN